MFRSMFIALMITVSELVSLTSISKSKLQSDLPLICVLSQQIDIMCNDEMLGKDHTLKFVQVTRWRFRSPPLKLSYRPRIDIWVVIFISCDTSFSLCFVLFCLIGTIRYLIKWHKIDIDYIYILYFTPFIFAWLCLLWFYHLLFIFLAVFYSCPLVECAAGKFPYFLSLISHDQSLL